jgi:integrase
MSELENWLATYRKKNTQILYRSAARHFFVSVYGGEIDRPDSDFENLSTKYVEECKAGRDWFQDLLDYAVYLGKDNRPPASAKTYMICARGFVEFSLNVELSRKQMKKLNGRLPKGKRARTVEGNLNQKVLRKILTHCDAKGNALFLTLATSGIRKGEALKLELDDIGCKIDDLTKDPSQVPDPLKVTVRGEIAKEGDTYYSFISREAKEALSEWLKVRNSYKKTSLKRGKGLSKLGSGQGVKKIDDQRLFPFSGTVADSMWIKAVKKAGFDGRDRSTNRHKFHIHMLRKFFQSQMKYAGVPEDLVEALIGHSGYLDDAYRRYNQKQIAEWYAKGEPHLLLNMSAETQVVISSEIDKQKEELDKINSLLVQIMAENKILEKKVEMHEKMFLKMTDMSFEEFQQWMQDKNRWEWQRQKEEDKKQLESRRR